MNLENQLWSSTRNLCVELQPWQSSTRNLCVELYDRLYILEQKPCYDHANVHQLSLSSCLTIDSNMLPQAAIRTAVKCRIR